MKRGDEGQFLMRQAGSEAAVALRKRRAEGLALMKAGLTNAEVMSATGAPLGTVKAPTSAKAKAERVLSGDGGKA